MNISNTKKLIKRKPNFNISNFTTRFLLLSGLFLDLYGISSSQKNQTQGIHVQVNNGPMQKLEGNDIFNAISAAKKINNTTSKKKGWGRWHKWNDRYKVAKKHKKDIKEAIAKAKKLEERNFITRGLGWLKVKWQAWWMTDSTVGYMKTFTEENNEVAKKPNLLSIDNNNEEFESENYTQVKSTPINLQNLRKESVPRITYSGNENENEESSSLTQEASELIDFPNTEDLISDFEPKIPTIETQYLSDVLVDRNSKILPKLPKFERRKTVIVFDNKDLNSEDFLIEDGGYNEVKNFKSEDEDTPLIKPVPSSYDMPSKRVISDLMLSPKKKKTGFEISDNQILSLGNNFNFNKFNPILGPLPDTDNLLDLDLSQKKTKNKSMHVYSRSFDLTALREGVKLTRKSKPKAKNLPNRIPKLQRNSSTPVRPKHRRTVSLTEHQLLNKDFKWRGTINITSKLLQKEIDAIRRAIQIEKTKSISSRNLLSLKNRRYVLLNKLLSRN